MVEQLARGAATRQGLADDRPLPDERAQRKLPEMSRNGVTRAVLHLKWIQVGSIDTVGA